LASTNTSPVSTLTGTSTGLCIRSRNMSPNAEDAFMKGILFVFMLDVNLECITSHHVPV
jgi:hypothetical protein